MVITSPSSRPPVQFIAVVVVAAPLLSFAFLLLPLVSVSIIILYHLLLPFLPSPLIPFSGLLQLCKKSRIRSHYNENTHSLSSLSHRTNRKILYQSSLLKDLVTTSS